MNYYGANVIIIKGLHLRPVEVFTLFLRPFFTNMD